MQIKRKNDQKWHFAENLRCGWADVYARENQFTATKEVDTQAELPADFCGECKKRRRIRTDE